MLTYIYQPAAIPAGPTLLLLHGTGGDERDLLPLAAHFGPDVNVLSVRGNVLEGGMPRFFRRLSMGIFDEDDVRFRTHELVQFLHNVSQQEGFNASQIVALGYSNGANIAGSILLHYPELLAGAILWRPMQPITRDVPTTPTHRRPPVLLTNGTHDPTVLPQASDRYAALLTSLGFAVTRQDFPTSHNLAQQDVDAAVAWFERHFPPASAAHSPA